MAGIAEQDGAVPSDNLPEALRARYAVVRRLSNGIHGPSWVLADTADGGFAVLRYLTAGPPPNALFAGLLRRVAAATVHCQDAVPVLGVLEDGVAVWLLRRWIPGENLAHALATLATLTPRQGKALIGGVCRGLLIDAGDMLIHGNLCPENVLIEETGRVRVSDHGLRLAGARSAQPLSLRFLAPELVDGDPPSLKSDVYALGALLYLVLCGRYPLAFSGNPESDRTILAAHELLPPPAGIRLGGGLGHVIWRACQPRPDDRFASARELLTALGRTGSLASTERRWRARLGHFG
jgi:serine/threonine protein kinase